MIEQNFYLITAKQDRSAGNRSDFDENFSEMLSKMLDSHPKLIYNYYVAEKFMCNLPQKYNYRVFCFTL